MTALQGDSLIPVPFDALAPLQRLQAAKLVREAFPQYYATLGGDADRIIVDEMNEKAGELSFGQGLVINDKIAGIVCGYSMNELHERQFVSFQNVLSSLLPARIPAFMENVRQLRAGLPDIEGDGTYLAFIAASESLRGKGIGDVLIDHFIRDSSSLPVYLTVRLDNLRALTFYRKHSFEPIAIGTAFAFLRQSIK